MPLTRYQIRNEYTLADPELYKAADKDDPEAVLEGVAMAGLVGVLRQLGDLAEFAAEIFHDLHEEVMVTAARGHGLMVRVQQLEAEFPSIEKAFLSQTNHSLFFSNTGVDWHPNLHMQQNLITRGDLPRCVMDSYEECRGPPRLFLLDKFDVAGAGACLKRYTDPSFFKVEAAVEVQREKKIRKVKKKGSRWRNGETPEIVPTSHAKLHELFLEESIEKGHSDPARLVRLKRRQLNASPLDPKPGKSYMEKFLDIPEHNVVREISVTPLALKLTSDHSSESGLEIHDISTVSPVKKSSRGKESTCSSPNSQEVVLKPSMDELYGEVFDRQIVKMPEASADGETEEILAIPHKVMVEKEIVVDGEGKMGDSVDGDNSDDMTSEVENFMDALTTMESEMETDNEYRPKTDLGFLNVQKRGTDSDRNKEQLECLSHCSDSQSIGNFSASDDGNSSFKKGRSSFSYSDTPSNLAENALSDGERSAKGFPSSEPFIAQIAETPSNQLPSDAEVLDTKSHDLVLRNDMSIDEDDICYLGEASSRSCLMDSNPTLLPVDPVATSVQHKLDGIPSEYVKPCSESSCIGETETNLVGSSAVVNNMPSHTKDVIIHTDCANNSLPVDNLDGGDPSVSPVVFSTLSNNSELAHERKSSDDSTDEVLQTDFAYENCPENSVNIRIDSAQSITSPRQEQVSCSAMPEADACSEYTSLPDSSSNVVKPNDLVYEVDDVFPETEAYREISSRFDNSETFSSKEEQVPNIQDDMQRVELESTEKAALCSEEVNLEDISRTADNEKGGLSTCKVVAVEGDDADDALHEIPSSCTDYSILEGRDVLDVVAGSAQAENMVVSTSTTDDVLATASVDNVVWLAQDLVHSSSSNLLNLQGSPFVTEDPDPEGLEFDEPVLPECLRGSEAEKEVNQLEMASKDFDSESCKLCSYDNSNLKMVDHGSSLDDSTQNSVPAGDVTVAPASSALSDQELESECLHQNYLLKDGEEATSSLTGNPPYPEISFEQSQELHADQLDVEVMQAEEASSNSSNHQSQLVKSSDHVDQERQFNGSSESCQEVLPSESSPSADCLAQSNGQEIDSAKHAMDPLVSVLPSFGLLSEANEVNLEEAPPLPPLPPMQWRLGKIQHAPLILEKESIDTSQELFPLILPVRDDDQQRGIVLPGNPFLPFTTVEMEKLHMSEQEVGNVMQPTPHLVQMSSMNNHENIQQNNLELEGSQSQHPFVPLPALPDEKPDHGILASEREVVQLSTNPFLSMPDGADTACRHEPVSSQEKLVHSQNQLAPETGSEGKALQPTSQNSEGEHSIPSDMLVLPPRKVEEQLQPNLATSEGEAAWSSNPFALLPTSEVGDSNGSSIVKLPRPRNPLIDAVAALDKSKLRKVSELDRPQNGPKLDERDSLLQQIRTKSFNLKPAVLSRPSIQGPKTNLRVAAILEKANAIRQATAGSDEDDDDDSWSDC